MELITDRYSSKITGTLSCYDRIVINGTLPEISNAQGMTSYLYKNSIRIFDYPKFAEPFRNQIRENAETIASDNDIEIEFVRKKKTRKEDLISKVLEKRGNYPGLVHVISVMESCPTYKPWHNKISHKTFLKPDQSKCLTYYFYFIDEVLGLCYIRVPTWCPFRLQIYLNGHNWLASKLKEKKIDYTMIDNAFDYIEDWDEAQKISDSLDVKELHERLSKFAGKYCPVYKSFNQRYHWSVMQNEYATDIVFKNQRDLQLIYSQLIKTAIHTVKPDNIATFLGRKLHGKYQGEVGNNYHVRIEGTRIKHTMGSTSIKMYDKFGKILRIETTSNDISFFKHYREVVHRDGTKSMKMASMKKNIYSMTALADIMKASNRRYLEFISTIEDNKVGTKKLNKVSKKVKQNNRTYKGFNFFDQDDENLFHIIARGEFNIYGFRAKNIRKYLHEKSSSQISRILLRFKKHGLIRRIANSYKYYLTKLGKQIIAMGMKIKNLFIIPELNLNYNL